MVTDGSGTPLAIEVTAGQVHESTRGRVGHRASGRVPDRPAAKARRRRHKPKQARRRQGVQRAALRDWLPARQIEPVIPHKDNEAARRDPAVRFDRVAYRGRCVVEQCVGWLKEFRRIGTRFEKLAVHFHGMLQLAMIRRYLRLLFSDRA